MENMFNKQKMFSHASRDGSLESLHKKSLQFDDNDRHRAMSLEDDEVRFTFQKQNEIAEATQKMRDNQIQQKSVQVKRLDLKTVSSQVVSKVAQ